MSTEKNISEIAKGHILAGQNGGCAYLKINHMGEITSLNGKLVVSRISYVKELEAQVKQLAAENVALRACADFYSSGFSPVKGAFGLEWKPSEKLLDDCGNVASNALKIPATDAYLSQLRNEAQAEGVEMFAKHCDVSIGFVEPEDDDLYTLMEEQARMFARQLREGTAGEVCGE